MAAASPQIGSVVTYTVKVSGNAIPDAVSILSISVEKKVNRISSAKITILDGEPNTGEFTASSSSTFLPGAEITIEAGYDAQNELIFKGIITGQSIRIDEFVGSALEVECRDAAVKMIVGRKNLTFSKKSDSDIISSIIGAYSGLSADVISTTTVWPEQVQYYVTDWDFVLVRAEINGLIVTTLNGKVSVFKPDADVTSVYTAKYGTNLIAFNADLNAITQLSSVTASTWDYKNQVVSSAQASNSYKGPGNLSSSTLAGVIGLSNYQLQTCAPLENDDLTDWSKAQLIKSEYSKIQGEVKFQGTNLVDPGKYITLQGLGDRFNGDHLISGVNHDLSDGNWITRVSVGLPPTWFVEEPDVMSAPASGLLPGVRGLISGTVKQMYNDPNSEFRILVNVPMFDQNGEGIWARMSNFYSTSGAGVFFLPEIGDEVVLGFLNEDPRYPIILGSMYSGSKVQPFTSLVPKDQNPIKAIVSKTGISVQFDDENKVLTILTPGNNTMVFSDKDNQILVEDSNGNSLTMSSNGIDIKSASNLNITAAQNVNIAGNQGVTVKSSGGDIGISGVNIKETAMSQYSAEGSMTAQINSGTELTLKSAMIMIN